MLYNTSSSRYRSFNRIYPSITARKYRYRNTFQRYSDTTVPHFTFFHQHPLRQKSQTSAIAFLPVFVFLTPPPVLPAPTLPKQSCLSLGSRPLTPAPGSHHPANQHSPSPSRSGSRLPALEFPGLPAAQILHKILISTVHMRSTAYNKINNLLAE